MSSADNLLFDRIVSILEQAQGNVVRAVNTNMVLAYWLIGREIVQEVQGGKERAEYGEKVVEDLSERLTERYGKGFSVPNLKNFRQFYLAYPGRCTSIGYPVGSQSETPPILRPMGRELGPSQNSCPTGTQSLHGFSPQLSWSHYRALMRIENAAARDFYERETIECGWSKKQLERQIHSFYYDRIIANRGEKGLLPEGRERLPGEPVQPASVLKSPMVLTEGGQG